MRKRIAHGPAIRAIRTAVGVSQSAFGPRVDISQPYLSQIESGDKEPGAPLLRRIADELGVPLDAISYTIPSCHTCEKDAA